MKNYAIICSLSCLLVSLSGCGGTRTIYVPSGRPVQLAQKIEADVWVFDKNGTKVKSRMIIPEGWYCIEDKRP